MKPERFAFSLAIEAILFAFGYIFLVASTWLVCLLPRSAHVPVGPLAIVFALSYAPLLFSFLGALPYLGMPLLWVLRVWHLLALVTAFSAIAGVADGWAAAYVGLGWVVMVTAQHTFGRPIAALGVRLLDAVAGVRLRSDTAIETGVVVARDGAAVDRAGVSVALQTDARRSHRARAWIGLTLVAMLTAVVAWTLAPVHGAVFGWYDRLPVFARVPFELVWIGFLATIVAGLLAPLETLGWWAGWYGDRIDDDAAQQTPGVDASPLASRYVIYLDGIAQSSARYTPDIETFLDALTPELPARVRLIRGIMAYSVLNRPLDDDPIFAAFWRFVDAVRLRNAASLLGLIINLRNVLIVAVSADQRYGPMYNFGIAKVMYDALLANGYVTRRGVPVTLIGYSGGGQMSAGSATILKRAIGAPVEIISLGGVISGACRILDLEHLYHLVGSKDGIQRLGPIMFPSRWRIAFASNWNRARHLGRISFIPLGPVGHQVPGGMLDPNRTLADGRTFLRQTLDNVTQILRGDLGAGAAALAGEGRVGAPVSSADAARYAPETDWVGRLILPEHADRARGVRFEVIRAPAGRRDSIGTIATLRWGDAAPLRDALRAATGDVHFSADALAAARTGLALPRRLDHWQLVDPLESLAGAHGEDDVVVVLQGRVDVASDAESLALTIYLEPALIAGSSPAPAWLPALSPGTYALLARGGLTSALEIGVAEVVPDTLSGEARCDAVFYRLGPHDDARSISGARQGWAEAGAVEGTRIACATSPDLTADVVEAIRLQLGVMAARYRTGDGSGIAPDGFGHPSARDGVRALWAGLRSSERLSAVASDLRGALQPFVQAPDIAGGENPFALATTFDEGPIESARGAVGGWRLWSGARAVGAFGRTFARHGWQVTTGDASARTDSSPTETARRG